MLFFRRLTTMNFLGVLLAGMAGLVWVCCSSGEENSSVEDSCLKPVYDCLGASGDCLLSTDAGSVTVTFDSGATIEGPIGLAVFDARNPSGEDCFHRSLEGGTIVIVDNDGSYFRVDRAGDGSITVTCPDGTSESWGSSEFPSTAPGIDPDVMTSCRVAGLCDDDDDCPAGQVCCYGKCEEGERCPGTCEVDEHCGEGNRCCDGWCTSLPSCNIPCTVDSQCDDGVYCNGQEICSNANKCQLAEPVICDDGIDCTLDECSEEKKRCVFVPDDDYCGPDQMCDPNRDCVDIIRCSGDEECVDSDPCLAGTCNADGICEFSAVEGCCKKDEECGDGVFCNGAEVCVDNVCQAGEPPSCEDEFECTDDICDTDNDACFHEPDDSKCAEGLVCNPSEGCVSIGDCEDDSMEENDSTSAAKELDSYFIYPLMLCALDEDWYKINVPMGSEVVVTVTYRYDTGSIDAFLLDELGEEVGAKETSQEGVIALVDDSNNERLRYIHVVSPSEVSTAYQVLVAAGDPSP